MIILGKESVCKMNSTIDFFFKSHLFDRSQYGPVDAWFLIRELLSGCSYAHPEKNILPSRRSILPHRCPASLNQSLAGSRRGARGLFLQRKTPRAESFFFLICFFSSSCLFFRFSLFFETPFLRFKEMTISKKQLMHVYKNVQGGDFNKK